MGSLKDPKTWIPHISPKDCSQKICNIYCTQWCKYVILPSPPPPSPGNDLGGAALSPVVIVIITLIGSFFLLIGYYIIISRHCLRNNGSSVSLSRQIENQETLNHDHDHGSNYVPWLVIGKGLDEAVIKSITICKYKKDDGLVSCTDCSVCLGEFQEDESIRLLPKCSHAFHVYCIDTWLKTHLNCPLCRANVCCVVKPSPLISPPPVTTGDFGGIDVAIEIREEGQTNIRRSKSMGYLLDQGEVMARQECRWPDDAGSSENVLEGNDKGGSKFVNVKRFGMERSY